MNTELMQQKENLPDYLRDVPVTGIEDMGKHQNMPRIKVLQATSDSDLNSQYGLGSAILRNENTIVAKFEEPFHAVPLLFRASFQKWADIKDTSFASPIVEENFDDDSLLAQRAKSRFVEDYGNGFVYSYCRSLNFWAEIISGEAKGIIAAISFVRGGEGVGKRLCGELNRRGCAIFCNDITFCVSKITNRQNNSWMQLGYDGIDFIGESELQRYQMMSEEITDAFGRGMVTASEANADE